MGDHIGKDNSKGPQNKRSVYKCVTSELRAEKYLFVLKCSVDLGLGKTCSLALSFSLWGPYFQIPPTTSNCPGYNNLYQFGACGPVLYNNEKPPFLPQQEQLLCFWHPKLEFRIHYPTEYFYQYNNCSGTLWLFSYSKDLATNN